MRKANPQVKKKELTHKNTIGATLRIAPIIIKC